MPYGEDQIKRIQEKLQALLRLHVSLHRENQQLREELAIVKKDSTEVQQQMEYLKQQVDILKFSNGDMNAEEKKQFEKKINTYVKEIDRCIALLSE